jgi:hypothetical protein
MSRNTFILKSVIAVLFGTLLLSCGKDAIKDNGTNPSPAPTLVPDAIPTPSVLIERYENEGFITRDLYRVIIVKPANLSVDEADLERQARAKAIASLKKYISASGKSLTSNTNAEILNLIGNSGTIKKVRVEDKVLFILDINRPGCRAYVDTLGQ